MQTVQSRQRAGPGENGQAAQQQAAGHPPIGVEGQRQHHSRAEAAAGTADADGAQPAQAVEGAVEALQLPPAEGDLQQPGQQREGDQSLSYGVLLRPPSAEGGIDGVRTSPGRR